jgi:steroid delta-isomerase-like uncharacterized protein
MAINLFFRVKYQLSSITDDGKETPIAGAMKRMGLLSVFLLVIILTCKQGHNDETKTKQEQTIRTNFDSFVENAWNNKNMDSLRAVSVENFNRHLNGIQVASNQNEMEANMNIFFNGFPDLKVSIENSTIKDNQLFAHWTFKGTNTGIFGEAPATGKSIIVSGYSELSFDTQGKIIREDVYYNELQLLQQLGYTLNPPNVD